MIASPVGEMHKNLDLSQTIANFGRKTKKCQLRSQPTLKQTNVAPAFDSGLSGELMNTPHSQRSVHMAALISEAERIRDPRPTIMSPKRRTTARRGRRRVGRDRASVRPMYSDDPSRVAKAKFFFNQPCCQPQHVLDFALNSNSHLGNVAPPHRLLYG